MNVLDCYTIQYSKFRHEGLFYFFSTPWNKNEIFLIYKKIVGIKFWKWLWWAMTFNPHRYCFSRQIVHFWWPYFVETALTANHCGCQILQEQRFSSKHALDAKYQSGSIFVNYSVSLLFLFHSNLMFSHQSRILSCMYYIHYKTYELLLCWKCWFSCSLPDTWRRIYCFFFKDFCKVG